jgi:hypothetical protein
LSLQVILILFRSLDQIKGGGQVADWNFTEKVSPSFCEQKEAEKLRFAGDFGTGGATTPVKQKFFASFFQKRRSSFLGALHEGFLGTVGA